MTHYSRRQFLHRSTGTAALSAALVSFPAVHTFGRQNSKLQVGLIGCGGVMKFHAEQVTESKDAEVRWLCDIDPAQIDKLHERVDVELDGLRTQRFEDVLEDPGVDAVVIGTPHHWHAPLTLRALTAGKDVYVEKPMSHVYSEGPLIAAAAEQHQRIVYHGTQMRSSPVTDEAARLLADGVIGEVKVARAWSAEKREATPPVPDSQPPAGVDYDRWLGPAATRPFNKHRFHKTWRSFRDYGNGEIGDDGIHDLDMACWGLGIDSFPQQITARGGVMHLQGDYSEYPDNMNVTYEFADGRVIIYEDFPFTEYGQHGYDGGNAFYGTEGYMVFSRRGAFSVFLGAKEKPGPTESESNRSERGGKEHMERFLRAVRTREPVHVGPQVAHRSCALVHLGEITYRTRGRLSFDPMTERFVDCPEANAMLTKDYRSPYSLTPGG